MIPDPEYLPNSPSAVIPTTHTSGNVIATQSINSAVANRLNSTHIFGMVDHYWSSFITTATSQVNATKPARLAIFAAGQSSA